jgi:hypothetical protein
MTNVEFDNFVKRQKAQASNASDVDPSVRRDEWLLRVNELYSLVEQYLDRYIKHGDIELSYEPLEIEEEYLGPYQTRRMTLKIGQQNVALVPIGALIIGAYGRVDLEGPKGRTKLLLVAKDNMRPKITISIHTDKDPVSEATLPPPQISLAWKLSTSPPSIAYIKLTKESLMEAILEVANA